MPAKKKPAAPAPTLENSILSCLSREWRKEHGLLAHATAPRSKPITPPTDEEIEQKAAVSRMWMSMGKGKKLSPTMMKLVVAFGVEKRKRRRPLEDTFAMLVLTQAYEDRFSLTKPIPKRKQPRNAFREAAKRLKARGINYEPEDVYRVWNSRWGRQCMRQLERHTP